MYSRVKIPLYLYPIYQHHYTYIVTHGGRGGAKSLSIVDYLLIKSFEDKNCQYLCAREIQKTLMSSVFAVFDYKIRNFGWSKYFHIQKSESCITNLATGVKIYFRGLWNDPDGLKGFFNLKIFQLYCFQEHSIKNQYYFEQFLLW